MNSESEQTLREDQQLATRGGKAALWISLGVGGGLFVFVATIALLILSLSSFIVSGQGTSVSTAPVQGEAHDQATETYQNDVISFAYPSGLKSSQDTGNATIFTPSGPPSDYQRFTSGEKTPSAIVEYMKFKGGEAVLSREARMSGMKQGVVAQKAASQSSLITMRSAAAHGCSKNFAYTDEPVLVERGELIGMTYGYTCDSFFGPITGNYIVWYDEYAAKHSVTVTALDSYWSAHKAQLDAIPASAKVLQRSSVDG